ncbi:hypothetical protein CKJ81_04450 [Corynebacterium hadale]|uniref:Uncharacterized protein n=1 Tax=Corynebacterium hadale TaxID=2026255 RepID=A0ABX4HA96_9CORY|nr:hypothetical protein [Corynebacterium hadale]PAT06221.1 hypothetical protein CKJ81_04450 [Corynebacterium hadale]
MTSNYQDSFNRAVNGDHDDYEALARLKQVEDEAAARAKQATAQKKAVNQAREQAIAAREAKVNEVRALVNEVHPTLKQYRAEANEALANLREAQAAYNAADQRVHTEFGKIKDAVHELWPEGTPTKNGQPAVPIYEVTQGVSVDGTTIYAYTDKETGE